jgi:hypothetical protein
MVNIRNTSELHDSQLSAGSFKLTSQRKNCHELKLGNASAFGQGEERSLSDIFIFFEGEV